MARTPNELLTQRRILAVASLAAGMLLFADVAQAEIIIDDFDDPAEVAEISNGRVSNPAVTEHVGDLDATRKMFFTASQTNPGSWSFDSNINSAFRLSAELHGHTRKSTNSAVITFPVRYSFSPIELTENGTNNALFFDFNSHQGTEAPLFLRVILESPPSPGGTVHDIYAANAEDFTFSDESFTTVIPFSSLAFRDGTPGIPDFSTVNKLGFDFFFLRPSEDIQWSIKLDRVRIGRILVPEPTCAWLCMLGVLILACCRVGTHYRPHSTGGSCDAKITCFPSRSAVGCGLLAALFLLARGEARGEIILDDFDDSAVAVSPAMENQLVLSTNVGELHSSRRIGTGGVGIDPVSQIDSNISAQSKLSAVLNGYDATATITPQVSFAFRYEFPLMDATEGGKNDAIIFDFASFSGTEAPLFFRGFVTEMSQPNEIFEIRVGVPLSSGPVTITMPFSAFHFRASNDGTADFSALTSASFGFFFLGPREDIQWSMQLERVRFSRIPEPSTIWLGLFAVISVLKRARLSVSDNRNKEG